MRVVMCYVQNRLTFSSPLVRAVSDTNFGSQAKMLPHSPYRNLPVALPTFFMSDNPMILQEDEEKTTLVTTRRVEAWQDQVPAWGNVAIDASLPTYYFEVTLMNRGSDGPIYVGLFAANKPLRGVPGQAVGSIGINDDTSKMQEGAAVRIEALVSLSGGGYWQSGDVVGRCLPFCLSKPLLSCRPLV
jgi:hypothetical protein